MITVATEDATKIATASGPVKKYPAIPNIPAARTVGNVGSSYQRKRSAKFLKGVKLC